jgi:hypothetical protein
VTPAYTPNALRALIRSSGQTRRAFAERHGIKPRALTNWCLPFSSAGHRDMPAALWLQVNNIGEANMVTSDMLSASGRAQLKIAEIKDFALLAVEGMVEASINTSNETAKAGYGAAESAAFLIIEVARMAASALLQAEAAQSDRQDRRSSAWTHASDLEEIDDLMKKVGGLIQDLTRMPLSRKPREKTSIPK